MTLNYVVLIFCIVCSLSDTVIALDHQLPSLLFRSSGPLRNSYDFKIPATEPPIIKKAPAVYSAPIQPHAVYGVPVEYKSSPARTVVSQYDFKIIPAETPKLEKPHPVYGVPEFKVKTTIAPVVNKYGFKIPATEKPVPLKTYPVQFEAKTGPYPAVKSQYDFKIPATESLNFAPYPAAAPAFKV